MAKGLKRICMNCGARFYDLDKTPIICPSCETEFTGEVKAKSRRGRAAAEEAPVVKEAEKPTVEDDDNDIDDIDADDDIVSLDDVDDDEDDDADTTLTIDDDPDDLEDDLDDLDDDIDEDDD
jgi:uncharacterized protein (TIGR02300 family)